MKREELLRHIRKYCCSLLREGGSHSWWHNPQLNKRSAVPRHKEIDDNLAKKVCKDIGIPNIKKWFFESVLTLILQTQDKGFLFHIFFKIIIAEKEAINRNDASNFKIDNSPDKICIRVSAFAGRIYFARHQRAIYRLNGGRFLDSDSSSGEYHRLLLYILNGYADSGNCRRSRHRQLFRVFLIRLFHSLISEKEKIFNNRSAS